MGGDGPRDATCVPKQPATRRAGEARSWAAPGSIAPAQARATAAPAMNPRPVMTSLRLALELDDDRFDLGLPHVFACVLSCRAPDGRAARHLRLLRLSVRQGETDRGIGERYHHVGGMLVHRGLLAGGHDR